MVSDWRGRRIVVGDVFLEEMPWDGSGGHDLDEDTMTGFNSDLLYLVFAMQSLTHATGSAGRIFN